MSQRKKQEKSSEKELTNTEPSSLADAELKTLIMKMLSEELRGRLDVLSENDNKEIVNKKGYRALAGSAQW